jgi:hypothetical protein
MEYKQLQELECHCGSREFHLDRGVTKLLPAHSHIDTVLCDEWCAFRQRRIPAGGVGPADCQECRSTAVETGKVVCSCTKKWAISNGTPQFSTKTVSSAESTQLRVVETDFSNDPRWNPFVKSQAGGLIFHHSLWLEALSGEFGQNTLLVGCEDAEGGLHASLPLVYTRGLPFGISHIGKHNTGRRLSSLPRTPVAGPLSDSREASHLLMQEAIRRVKSDSGLTLQLKLQSNELDGLVEGVRGTPWREAFVLELPGRGVEQVRFGNAKQHHKITWAVNRARRLGIVAREADSEDDLRTWYRIYLEAMRRVFAPARPYRFFLRLWRSLQPRGLMRILIAEREGAGRQEFLAGSIFLMYGQTVHYAFTGCRTDSMGLHINDLIQWEAIQRANREGFRFYDFGEGPEERQGLTEFKSKWCAKPVLLYRYQYPGEVEEPTEEPAGAGTSNGNEPLLKKFWQRLPLGWTEYLSEQIFRRL